MYLKNINGKQLFVLNVNIRSAREDFKVSEGFQNIFSHNLDLRENISFVSARKLFLRENKSRQNKRCAEFDGIKLTSNPAGIYLFKVNNRYNRRNI